MGANHPTTRCGKALFIYTPYGPNHGLALWEGAAKDPEWGRIMYKASESGVLSETELASARKSMPEETYQQEMECSFSTRLHGSIYGEIIDRLDREGRIGHVPHRLGADVDTCWDLGYGDSTTIAFVQRAGRGLHFVDYYEASGAGIEHYVRMLREKSDQLGYRYRRHYGPHDTLSGSLQTGKSLKDIAREAGLRFEVVKRGSVDTGINEVRKLLEISWMDSVKCARLVEALRAYRREWDERLRMFREKPLHDWSSHACDALRTGAMGGLLEEPIDPSTIETQAETEWNPFRELHRVSEHSHEWNPFR